MPYLIVAVIILIIDQIAKYWTNANLVVDSASPIIPGVVQLTNVQNRGAAFGIFQDGRWFFIVLTIAVVIAAIILIRKNIIKGKLGRWMLVLVIAGGLGNCIDRLFKGYVTDMFQLQFMNFAIFNVADIFITIGGIIFCLYLVFHREPQEETDEASEAPEAAPELSATKERKPILPKPRERALPKDSELPVKADYISQLKRPVVEGRKNMEAEIAAKTIEAAPVRPSPEAELFKKDEVTITDWNMPDFAKAPPASAPKPEVPTPAKQEPALTDPRLVNLEQLLKEPAKPVKQSESEYSVDDILAEFRDK
ncbi:MAG: signal peptidase II [Clostridia bacterium]|nr:signal peptidase II [Clostridia bacterium]